MSDKMTEVSLPGKHAGFADWGDHDPLEMIAQLRRIARRDLEAAQAVLDAEDEAFIVKTYRGPYAQRDLKVIWPDSGSAE